MKPVPTLKPKRGGIIADPVPKRRRKFHKVPFLRDELQSIRNRAQREALAAGTTTWFRAYTALVDAADRLDAMIARRHLAGAEIFEEVFAEARADARRKRK